MSQCVPSWELDDPLNLSSHIPLPSHQPAAPVVPMPDYEVAELTWDNGNLALHGLGHPRVGKPIPKHPSAAAEAVWDKPRPSGTLEAVVDQATRATNLLPLAAATSPADLAAWLRGGLHHARCSTAMDAIVPSAHADDLAATEGRKRARVGTVSQGSAAAVAPAAQAGRASESMTTLVTLDTCGADDVGFTTSTTAAATYSASPTDGAIDGGEGSPEAENTSFGGHDSVGHSRQSQLDVCDEEEKLMKGDFGRSSISTKRSRAAEIHNQSERKRRDRINQKMKTLQKLVPNSSKTDKASMLDEVIEYLKQLQAQVQMMCRMNSMMMPMPLPLPMPQLQMSMMANMAQMAQMAQMAHMGMMDPSCLARAGPTSLPSFLHPSACLPLAAAASWNGAAGDRMQQPNGTVLPDPFSAFLACQAAQQQQQQTPPPMSMDAYNRMAALHQQLYQQSSQANPKT